MNVDLELVSVTINVDVSVCDNVTSSASVGINAIVS